MATLSNSIPDPTVSKPARRRRWIPLSLRMFVVMLMLVFVGSVLWIIVPAYQQQMAIREIQKAGGTVVLTPGGSDWIREQIGDKRMKRFFVDEVWVHLEDTSANDATLAHFSWLTGLKSLSLKNTQVSDSGLAQLKGLSRLGSLEFNNTQVTDAGLAHLSGLTELFWLNLDDTQVSDAGLVHLKRLTKLQALFLDGTDVTDRGLIHLEGLTRLQRVWLKRTQVTAAGIAELKRARPKLTIVK